LILNNPTEKSMLGCARTLSEGYSENLLHSSEVWRSIHIVAGVDVSKKAHT